MTVSNSPGADSPESGANKSLLVRYGDFLFRTRNLVFPVVMVALLLAFRPVYLGGSAGTDLWLDLAGVVIVLAGLAVRALVIGLAYIKRGGLNKRVHADTLVVEGIFAHVRNPLYLGNLLMLVGYFVIHNSPWVYLLGGIYFLISYIAIVAAEEHFLAGKFGADFTDYCSNTGRWLPKLHGLGRTLDAMTFNWRRVIIKDYSTAFTGTVTVLFLFAYQVVVARGFDGGRGALVTLGIAVLVAAALTLLVRFLKKTKRLREAPAGEAAEDTAGNSA